MKRVIFTLFAVLSFAVVSKAATYYWIGGLNATSFTSGGNWTTDPVTRTPVSGSITIGTSDVFIFDGTNVGPTITPVTTGSIVILAGSLSSSPFAQLKLINAANLTIGRSSSGSSGADLGPNPRPERKSSPPKSSSDLSTFASSFSSFEALGDAFLVVADVSAFHKRGSIRDHSSSLRFTALEVSDLPTAFL